MPFFSKHPPALEEPPEQLLLGRYRMLGEAGAGGFGTVQLAWDTRMQRRVAVKVIDLAGIVGEGVVIDAVDQLPDYALTGLDEARTAAMLNHANIVTVHDFEVWDNRAYLIMEYVDGMTLTDLLKVVGDDITIDMVTAVFDGVAAALEYAHENQVLHLDIKPDNVMIDHQGQVKVMDFGLARLSGSQGYSAATGGTIGYMPPEQMMRESLDARCDEWALASLTYEMISGQNPFLANDLSAALDRIDEAELVLPSLCMSELPSGIDDVIFYALDPNRYARYATVEDFADEMNRFLGSAATGRKQLSMVVRQAIDDGDAVEYAAGRRRPRRSRFAGNVAGIALRIVSAANVGILTYAGLTAIPQLGGWNDPICWGSTIAIAILAAATPRFASPLGIAVLVAALIFGKAYVMAAVLGIAGIVWWALAGRLDDLTATGSLMGGSMGALGMNQFTPLICGFFMTPGRAAGCAAFASLLALTLAACGTQSMMGWYVPIGVIDGAMAQRSAFTLITNPTVWCVAASWTLAALLTGACCQRRTKPFEVLGILLGGLILVGGSFVSGWIESGFTSWTSPTLAYLMPALVAVALGIIVVFAAHRLVEGPKIARSLGE